MKSSDFARSAWGQFQAPYRPKSQESAGYVSPMEESALASTATVARKQTRVLVARIISAFSVSFASAPHVERAAAGVSG
jgi:hypothetical protein